MKTLDHVRFYLIENQLIVDHNGKSTSFERASLEVMDLISNDLARTPNAEKALTLMGITDPVKQLRQFAICRYTATCKHKCRFHNTICVDAFAPGITDRFSTFELIIIKKMASGIPPYIIATQMDTSYTNVRRIVSRAKHQLNISTHAGLGAWAAKIGIV